MSENSPFRFAVGSWVQTMIAPNAAPGSIIAFPMQVIERQLQECHAGTQAWYTCRVHVIEARGIEWTAGQDLRKYNDIELQAYEPRADKPMVNRENLVNRESLMRRLSRILSQLEETPNDPS